MYFDIFLPGTWSIVEDPGADVENGVHLDGPGAPKRIVVYAERRLNLGRLQCLVTPEQRAAIKADGVPLLNFSQLPANEKAASGGPAHVFGDRCVELGEDGEPVIYKPGSGTPEPRGE